MDCVLSVVGVIELKEVVFSESWWLKQLAGSFWFSPSFRSSALLVIKKLSKMSGFHFTKILITVV